MRRIVCVSVGRSDVSILRPIIKELRETSGVQPVVIAIRGREARRQGGANLHLSEPFDVDETIPLGVDTNDPAGMANAIGRGVLLFAKIFQRLSPHIVLVVGDRFETFSAATAALPLGIPLAHVHGGEVTEGALDDSWRHAISKMSHLHFVSARVFRDRLVRMGEEPWRITVSGAPGLDNLSCHALLSRTELERVLRMSLTPAPLMVTYHPVTLDPRSAGQQIQGLLAALSRLKIPVVITAPNADAGYRDVRKALRAFVGRTPSARWVEGLGSQGYYTLMTHARAMVGNSSSGIIEAASFRLPVVNIGFRQAGRMHGPNVVDVGDNADDIVSGVRRTTTERFRKNLARRNPYGDGGAAWRIVDVLRSVPLDQKLRMKRFYDGGRGD